MLGIVGHILINFDNIAHKHTITVFTKNQQKMSKLRPFIAYNNSHVGRN